MDIFEYFYWARLQCCGLEQYINMLFSECPFESDPQVICDSESYLGSEWLKNVFKHMIFERWKRTNWYFTHSQWCWKGNLKAQIWFGLGAFVWLTLPRPVQKYTSWLNKKCADPRNEHKKARKTVLVVITLETARHVKNYTEYRVIHGQSVFRICLQYLSEILVYFLTNHAILMSF